MQSWPALLSGLNLLALSPTGSGKTYAYSLPMIPHIQAHMKVKSKSMIQIKSKAVISPVCLVIVPTRELALQVSTSLKNLHKLFHIYTVAVFGHDEETQVNNLTSIDHSISIVSNNTNVILCPSIRKYIA